MTDRYRAIVMIPTEMFVDTDSIEEALATVSWIREEYPSISYSASTTGGNDVNRLVASAKVLYLERVDEE